VEDNEDRAGGPVTGARRVFGLARCRTAWPWRRSRAMAGSGQACWRAVPVDWQGYSPKGREV